MRMCLVKLLFDEDLLLFKLNYKFVVKLEVLTQVNTKIYWKLCLTYRSCPEQTKDALKLSCLSNILKALFYSPPKNVFKIHRRLTKRKAKWDSNLRIFDILKVIKVVIKLVNCL